MDVSKVTKEDGLACAHLLNFLKKGRWDMTGDDSELLYKTKVWVQQVALKMAEQLKAVEAGQPPAGGFKIKSMGPIGGGSAAPTKGKRKK